ncbi:type IV pili methyl-accepting chemotaxis transducer N-terminal domain-containing protein [Roseateles sp. GG27B]
MKASMFEPDLPSRLLVLGHCPPELAAALAAAGCSTRICATRHSLVQDALESSAQALLLWPASGPADATDGAELDVWLAALELQRQALPALPGVCIAMTSSTAQQQRGFGLGLQVWLAQAPASVPELQQQLRWAAWQAARLAGLQTQLDERRWTDRAKGLLMTGQNLDEAAAYQLLRETAMHAHLRLGEVARSVVQAAQQAEALNLAGQQRMLSQRLVKLLAQRAAAIEPRRAKVLQDESCARVDANLARLRVLLTASPAALTWRLAAVEAAWLSLRALLVGKVNAAVLTQADAAAEALLTLSDQLASAIETGSGPGGRPLRLVNLCGRQRMLSQRLAKDALLADLLPGFDAARIALGLSGFEAGLTELEAAPLSSPEIRASLDAVRAEWLRLLRSLRDVQGAAAGLARSSELLLTHLDSLTARYQQSLQVVLG